MKKILLSIILVLLMVPYGWAVTYTGSITSDDYLVASFPWSVGASLSWEVSSPVDDDNWYYRYVFHGVLKDISHAIIEVSENFDRDNILRASDGIDDDAPMWYSPGTSNPYMPDYLYGIKWEFDDNNTVGFALVSDRKPMWGDFYAKDGIMREPEPHWVVAFNSEFGNDSDNPIGNGNNDGWILVPDTESEQVPDPGTIVLLGSGLLSLAFYGRKKFRK